MHPRVYTQSEHLLKKEQFDQDAIWAVLELQRHGHTAYIVGGCIRDLLLKKSPKDFDISTSARPEEIKKIFGRRCLIIGKRFRLAHIRFENSIIETSTFRAGDTEGADLITRDNCWGTEEEDVFRRDFTMNGLFYNPTSEELLDYVGGVLDISARLIRTIGDAETRFRQDPVRMLRLLKFLARFDLCADKSMIAAMAAQKTEIVKSAPARIFEELMKMMESGSAKPFFQLLDQHGFLDLLIPMYQQYREHDTGALFFTYLNAIDRMVQAGHKHFLNRSIYTSAFIFPLIEHEILELLRAGPHIPTMRHILHSLEQSLHQFSHSSFPHFPKKLMAEVSSLLVHQFRITPLKGAPKFSIRFPSDQEFRDSLLLLNVRASIDPELTTLWHAWHNEYQHRIDINRGHATRRPLAHQQEKQPHGDRSPTKRRRSPNLSTRGQAP